MVTLHPPSRCEARPLILHELLADKQLEANGIVPRDTPTIGDSSRMDLAFGSGRSANPETAQVVVFS